MAQAKYIIHNAPVRSEQGIDIKVAIKCVIITVPGAGGGPGEGGSDGPNNIYTRIAYENSEYCVVRSVYSKCKSKKEKLNSAVADTLECIAWVTRMFTNKPIFLIGWSMGGAVIINAIKLHIDLNANHLIRGFITLAGQNKSTDALSEIKSVPKLFVHGTADNVISIDKQKLLYDKSQEPKEIRALPDNGHDVADSYQAIILFIKKYINV